MNIGSEPLPAVDLQAMTAWRMAFRNGKGGTEMWPHCRRLGVAAITYRPIQDIDFSQFPGEEQFPAVVKAAWSQLKGTQPASLRRFLYEMEEEDVIYVKQGPMIVGKGVVGPYIFDEERRIRDPDGDYWRQQRIVKWMTEFPEVRFTLGAPQVVAVVRLTDEEVTSFEQAVSRFWLPAEEADRTESNDDLGYIRQEIDRRDLVWNQIRERRGQQHFRDALRQRYKDRCLVTGCKVVAVLEAAHIDPYRSEDNNHQKMVYS
jgi:hypothetical protein